MLFQSYLEGVIMMCRSMPFCEDFLANRPFFFAITENANLSNEGALFVGRLNF